MTRGKTIRVGVLGLLLATCAWQLWPEVRAWWPRAVGADEVLIPVQRNDLVDPIESSIHKYGPMGFIDENGDERLPFVWNLAEHFDTAGMARVVRGGKLGWIDRRGQIVIEPQWEPSLQWLLSLPLPNNAGAFDTAGWAPVGRNLD